MGSRKWGGGTGLLRTLTESVPTTHGQSGHREAKIPGDGPEEWALARCCPPLLAGRPDPGQGSSRPVLVAQTVPWPSDRQPPMLGLQAPPPLPRPCPLGTKRDMSGSPVSVDSEPAGCRKLGQVLTTAGKCTDGVPVPRTPGRVRDTCREARQVLRKHLGTRGKTCWHSCVIQHCRGASIPHSTPAG